MISHEESGRLIIALEPECASIISIKNYEYDETYFAPNKKFLILDCGGGTIDITTHEIIKLRPLELKELLAPCGGPFGSICIDHEFFNFIKKLIGSERYLKLINSEAYLELEKKWEECKVNFSIDKSSNEYIKINLAPIIIELDIKKEFEDMITKWNTDNPNLLIKSHGGSATLDMSYELMMSFFKMPIEQIIDTVASVIDSNQEKLSDLSHVIMAGGYSRNAYLHKRMIEEFQTKRNIKIMLGQEPDLLIVRGAAVFGADPESIIKSRKAKFSFGISCTINFDHLNPLHMIYKDFELTGPKGESKLKIFDTLVKKGDDISVGTVTKRNYYNPAFEGTSKIEIDILKSSLEKPFHVSDADPNILAKVVVPINKSLPMEDRGFGIEFSFATSEVVCYVYSIKDNLFLNKAHIKYSTVTLPK